MHKFGTSLSAIYRLRKSPARFAAFVAEMRRIGQAMIRRADERDRRAAEGATATAGAR